MSLFSATPLVGSDSSTSLPIPTSPIPPQNLASCTTATLSHITTQAANAAAAAIACPKPRPTLASTAALFIPDQSSPILLAPSESEIQSALHYYTFGAQLVTALVLFFMAYSCAYIILGWVRRRERKAKLLWKAELKKVKETEILGRIPVLHPTLYHVAPAITFETGHLNLDLSDPIVALSALTRVKRRVRRMIDWVIHGPARIRRRLRGVDKAKQVAQAKVQQVVRTWRNNNLAPPATMKSPPPESTGNSFRRRLSKISMITSFFHRTKQDTTTSNAANSSQDTKARVVDDSVTLDLILGSFTSMLPSTLPWLKSQPDPQVPAPRPRNNRRGTITDTISNWTAALSGANRTTPSPSPSPPPNPPSSSVSPAPADSHSPLSPSPPPPTQPRASPHPHLIPELPSDDLHSLLTSAHSDFPDEENEREFLTYSLATFVLAIALFWLELLVLSVLASTSLHGISLNQYYVFKWCTKEFVTILWIGTVWLSSISLFVLTPFGFLYYEAEGLGGRKGFVSRVSETLVVLSAFTVLLYGSFHLLQLLLDRGGLLNPFTYTHPTPPPSPLEEFSFYELFENSLGFTFAKLILSNLESLYSNVWHFLPGLIMLLMTCHHGFISLISGAYSIGNVSLDAFSVATNSKREHQLNAIKLELNTAERKWHEMELEFSRLRHHRPTQLKSSHSARAIAPSSYRPPITTISATQRKALLARIHQLREDYALISREMQPTSWSVRMRSSLYVRNTLWILFTLSALLLTWHIILRVAQREARLIFRGSIFRWFRSEPSPLDLAFNPVEDQGRMANIMRTFWSILYQLKNQLGHLLSLLTGRVLGGKSPNSSIIGFNSTTHNLAPSIPVILSPPLFDFPLLSGVFEFFRLLVSVLLGINGFNHPLVAFLVDISCIGFFLFASAYKIYRSPFLRQFSPLYHYQIGVDKRSTTASLIFSPQFFTVNAAILLLLASSLPLATWMLGLSSFDLLEFYPHSSVQFSTIGTGGATSVPLFVHLYNFAFLALTGWHITQISKKIVLWVIFDQIVARIEFVIEWCRVALGWAKKNAKPEDRFQLFGRCRRRSSVSGPPRTKLQLTWYLLTGIFVILKTLLAPIVRGIWFLVRRIGWVVLIVMQFLWLHVHACLSSELADEQMEKDETTVSESSEPHTIKEETTISSNSIVHTRTESSITSELLAEIDAATEAIVPEEDYPVAPPNDPSASTGSSTGLAFFARSISAPPRLHPMNEDAVDSTSSPLNETITTPDREADDVDPLLGHVPATYSPLYRSVTTWTDKPRTVESRHIDFMTPLVSSVSRKLTNSSFMQELVEPSSKILTEADFPLFSPISPIAEEDKSASSSAAPTPQLSPSYSPEFLSTPLRSSHRATLLELENDVFDLSASSDELNRTPSSVDRDITPNNVRHRFSSMESDDSTGSIASALSPQLHQSDSTIEEEQSGAQTPTSSTSDPSILLNTSTSSSPIMQPCLNNSATASQSTSSDSDHDES